MNLKEIMLSEKNLKKIHAYSVFPFVKTHEMT